MQGPRSSVFPLLRDVCCQVGEKTVSAVFVGNPLPDEVAHALFLQRRPQTQQQHPHSALNVPRGTALCGSRFEEAKAALAAGAAAAASALAAAAQGDWQAPSASSGRPLSLAPFLSVDLLRSLESQEAKQALQASTQVLRLVAVEAQGSVLPEGESPSVVLRGRKAVALHAQRGRFSQAPSKQGGGRWFRNRAASGGAAQTAGGGRCSARSPSSLVFGGCFE